MPITTSSSPGLLCSVFSCSENRTECQSETRTVFWTFQCRLHQALVQSGTRTPTTEMIVSLLEIHQISHFHCRQLSSFELLEKVKLGSTRFSNEGFNQSQSTVWSFLTLWRAEARHSQYQLTIHPVTSTEVCRKTIDQILSKNSSNFIPDGVTEGGTHQLQEFALDAFSDVETTQNEHVILQPAKLTAT